MAGSWTSAAGADAARAPESFPFVHGHDTRAVSHVVHSVGRARPGAGRDCIASLLPGVLNSEDAAESLRSFSERREARFTGR